MGQRLSSAELTEWQAFYLLEPWGTEPAALNSAITASVLANVNRKPDSPAFRPSDFMPAYGLPKKQIEPTAQERSDQIRNLLKRD
jgi:hypothetical protein